MSAVPSNPSSQRPTRDDVESFCSAADNGDATLVALFLVKYGASIINQKNGIDSTALMEAAAAGESSIAKMLIENGAAVDEVDDIGYTALTYAVVYQRDDAAKLLLDVGASVHHCDKIGKTMLMFAAMNGSNSLMTLLLEYGADLHAADTAGRTPLSVAEGMHHVETVALIRREIAADQVRKREEHLRQAREFEASLRHLKQMRPDKPLLKNKGPK